MINPVYHTYASVADLQGYLLGTNQQQLNANNTPVMLRILEAVSRRIDKRFGERSFGPRVETHSFDLGLGGLRSQQLVRTGYETLVPSWDRWLWQYGIAGAAVLPLDDWLVSATTVTAYSETNRPGSTTLIEGIGNDFLLEPYNTSPKTLFKLEEDSAKTLTAGQQTLAIAGIWGWQNITQAAGALGADIADTTGTAVTLANGHSVAVGHTLLVGTEQIYVRALTSNAATVVRGVNGTTAATHASGAAVSINVHPSDVVECCIEIARNRWKARDQGNQQVMDQNAQTQFFPGQSEKQLLDSLFDDMSGHREMGGVYF